MLNRKNNNIVSYNPFRDIEEFEKSFFGDPFGSFFRSNELAEFKIDVTDEGDHYEMEADLPGFEKKDIHLEVNGDTLRLSAERHSKVTEKDKKKIRLCTWSAPMAPTRDSLTFRVLKPTPSRQNTKTACSS